MSAIFLYLCLHFVSVPLHTEPHGCFRTIEVKFIILNENPGTPNKKNRSTKVNHLSVGFSVHSLNAMIVIEHYWIASTSLAQCVRNKILTNSIMSSCSALHTPKTISIARSYSATAFERLPPPNRLW